MHTVTFTRRTTLYRHPQSRLQRQPVLVLVLWISHRQKSNKGLLHPAHAHLHGGLHYLLLLPSLLPPSMIAQAKVVYLPLPPTLILRMPHFGDGNRNTFPRKPRLPLVQTTSLVTLQQQTALISPWHRATNQSPDLHFPAICDSILHLAASSW